MTRSLVAAAIAAAVSTSADQAVGAKSETFKTALLSISEPWLSTVTTLWTATSDSAEAPVRPRINMVVTNVSDRNVWVEIRLTAPPPHAGTIALRQLGPKKSFEFESTQDRILADVDYALAVGVFSDSALADTVEQSSASFHFEPAAVEAIEARVAQRLRELETEREAAAPEMARVVEATQLPRTYERIMFFEGSLNIFSGNAFTPRGTLTVATDSLIYRSKRRTFAISGTQLRAVSVRNEGGKRCVAVEYDDAGTPKEIRFVAGLVHGLDKNVYIRASLLALKARSAASR